MNVNHASKRGESQISSSVANRLQPDANFVWFTTDYNAGVILWSMSGSFSEPSVARSPNALSQGE